MAIPILPIDDGSTYPYPGAGGSESIGAQAYGRTGELLTWTGAQWSLVTPAQAADLSALVSGGVVLAAIPLVTTWVARAAALAANRSTILPTDVGLGIASMYYSGRWRWTAGQALLRNLITPATHNTSTRAIMDYAVIPAGLLGDGDILDILWTKQLTGTDTDTTELSLSPYPAVWGSTLPLATSVVSTGTPQGSVRYRLMRVNATTLRAHSISGGLGFGSAASVADVTVNDMDAAQQYLQISGKLTTGAGAVTTLRGFTVQHIVGA